MVNTDFIIPSGGGGPKEIAYAFSLKDWIQTGFLITKKERKLIENSGTWDGEYIRVTLNDTTYKLLIKAIKPCTCTTIALTGTTYPGNQVVSTKEYSAGRTIYSGTAEWARVMCIVE